MTISAPGLPLYDYTVLKSVRAVCPTCFADDPNFDPQHQKATSGYWIRDHA
ncbi:MAG TPA: hypothetical protein VII69_03165 [Candidatus Eremiobacteraceae bacterium]